MNCCKYNDPTALRLLKVKEMRFGTREEFDYSFCDQCRTLWSNQVPQNIDEFYACYYTYDKRYHKISNTKVFLWRLRSFLSLHGFNSFVNFLTPNTLLSWANFCKLKLNHRLLDVGCGKGDILFEFYKHGFRKLYGVDPYPPATIDLNFGWNFIKGDIFNVEERDFDLIMFNHSLEHMTEHASVLAKAKELLSAKGKILIRMPIINKAFNIYRENWVQIDAPRHFIIYSPKSFSMLCERLGFIIKDVFFDSTEFQFLGSEQNCRDISFFDKNSYKVNLSESIFSEQEITKYKRMAAEYNKKGFGDQAGFILESK